VYLPLQGFFGIEVPEDNLSTEQNMQHTREDDQLNLK
jgi:hypothetical protein